MDAENLNPENVYTVFSFEEYKVGDAEDGRVIWVLFHNKNDVVYTWLLSLQSEYSNMIWNLEKRIVQKSFSYIQK